MNVLRTIPPFKAILVLGLFLSVASLWYSRTQPTCYYACEGGACPLRAGTCGATVLYAGFPLPVLYDNSGGSSSSSGGNIQFDDITSLNAPYFLANTLLYIAALWLLFEVGSVLWQGQDPNRLLKRIPIPFFTLAGVLIFMVVQLQSASIPTVTWVDQPAIQGEWALIEPVAEAGLRLSFDGQGTIPELSPDGKYRWYSSNQIEIWVNSWKPSFCDSTFFFLQPNCRTTLLDASAYPSWDETVFPVSAYPYPAPDGVFPTPIPTATPDPNAEPLQNSYTSAAFTVHFEGDIIILDPVTISTPPLLFRRVSAP